MLDYETITSGFNLDRRRHNPLPRLSPAFQSAESISLVTHLISRMHDVASHRGEDLQHCGLEFDSRTVFEYISNQRVVMALFRTRLVVDTEKGDIYTE